VFAFINSSDIVSQCFVAAGIFLTWLCHHILVHMEVDRAVTKNKAHIRTILTSTSFGLGGHSSVILDLKSPFSMQVVSWLE